MLDDWHGSSDTHMKPDPGYDEDYGNSEALCTLKMARKSEIWDPRHRGCTSCRALGIDIRYGLVAFPSDDLYSKNVY